MSYNPTPKWVLNQNASFQEEITVADAKTVTHGGDPTYKIVQTVDATTDVNDKKAELVIGNATVDSEDYVKLNKDSVMIKETTEETKLESKTLQLNANRTLSVVAGDNNSNVVLENDGAKLSIVHRDNQSAFVGPQNSKAELHFISGIGDHAGHEGYIPILDSNHMIPTEYLSNAFAFDGKLIFRHHIYLKRNAGNDNWELNSSSMGKPSWYGNAKQDLDPAAYADSSASPAEDKYWNYAFATGSYFLVNFDITSTAPPADDLPATISLGSLLTLLANAELLDQYNGSGLTSWYNGGSGDNFVNPSQGTDYEVSQSDMIVIRNKTYAAALSTANSWLDKIEVTVIDNSDEFQKRLVSANELKFPNITANTLHITDTAITGSTSAAISFTSEQKNAAGISLTAKNTVDSQGGMTVVAGTHGVIVDSDGLVSLDSSATEQSALELKASGISADTTLVINSLGTGASAIDIDSSGGVDIDAFGAFDIKVDSVTDAMFDESTPEQLDTAKLGAFHVDSAGGIGLDAAKRVSILSSQNGPNAIRLYAAGASGQISMESKTGGVDVDSSGSISLTSSFNTGQAIWLDANQTVGGGIDIDANSGGVDIDSAGVFDVLAQYDGANAIKMYASGASGSVLLQNDGTNGFLIDNNGGDMEVNSTGLVKLHASSSTSDYAIWLKADSGGVDVDATKSVKLVARESVPDAIHLQAGTATLGSGGIDIDAGTSGVDVDTSGQISLVTTKAGEAAVEINADGGGADTTIHINSEGSGAQAINIDSAGGVDVDATGAVAVDAGAQLSLVSSQESDTAVVINASGTGGGIDIDAKSGGIDVDSTGDVNVATTSTSSSGALVLSSTAGKGRFVAPTLDLGNSSANDAGSVNLLNDTCLSFAGRRIMGCLRAASSSTGGVVLTMTPERGQGKNASFFVSLRFTAADGQNDSATSTWADPRQASGTINLCYHYKSDGTGDSGQTVSVDVQNYYFNGPLVAYVGYQNDTNNDASEAGNLIIWLGWSGTKGSDFDVGGQWSVSYDISHDQEVLTSTTGSDDLKYARLKFYDGTTDGESLTDYTTFDLALAGQYSNQYTNAVYSTLS